MLFDIIIYLQHVQIYMKQFTQGAEIESHSSKLIYNTDTGNGLSGIFVALSYK